MGCGYKYKKDRAMNKNEVESYVRKLLREEFTLPMRENADLKYTDPARYEELCRKGIDWMDADLRKDEALKAMCHVACLNFDSIMKEEKLRVLKQFEAPIN